MLTDVSIAHDAMGCYVVLYVMGVCSSCKHRIAGSGRVTWHCYGYDMAWYVHAYEYGYDYGHETYEHGYG